MRRACRDVWHISAENIRSIKTAYICYTFAVFILLYMVFCNNSNRTTSLLDFENTIRYSF